MAKPNFFYEKKAWSRGYVVVIGVDEVGRGAFAGPIVAGAAALKIGKCTLELAGWDWRKVMTSAWCRKINSLGIDDSKRLSPKKREKLACEIKKYFYWAVGEGSVADINRLGIVKAAERAMRRAIKNLTTKQRDNAAKQATFVLIDAFRVKYMHGIGLTNQEAVKHGDQKSISIAAASIMAKVYRDNLIIKLSQKSDRYSKYLWEKNKGYGTKQHREAIARYGITRLHRKKFVKASQG